MACPHPNPPFSVWVLRGTRWLRYFTGSKALAKETKANLHAQGVGTSVVVLPEDMDPNLNGHHSNPQSVVVIEPGERAFYEREVLPRLPRGFSSMVDSRGRLLIGGDIRHEDTYRSVVAAAKRRAFEQAPTVLSRRANPSPVGWGAIAIGLAVAVAAAIALSSKSANASSPPKPKPTPDGGRPPCAKPPCVWIDGPVLGKASNLVIVGDQWAQTLGDQIGAAKVIVPPQQILVFHPGSSGPQGDAALDAYLKKRSPAALVLGDVFLYTDGGGSDAGDEIFKLHDRVTAAHPFHLDKTPDAYVWVPTVTSPETLAAVHADFEDGRSKGYHTVGIAPDANTGGEAWGAAVYTDLTAPTGVPKERRI